MSKRDRGNEFKNTSANSRLTTVNLARRGQEAHCTIELFSWNSIDHLSFVFGKTDQSFS